MVPQPPEFLVQRLRERQCILFVGSGLSTTAHLPMWSDLLRDITAWAEREKPGAVSSSEVNDFLAKNRLLEVAEHLRETIGLDDLHRALSERLQVDACPIPEVHQLITQLPFRALITTNFDHLLEKAFNYKIPVVTQLDAGPIAEYIGDPDSFFLLKAHGTLGRPETIVLTEADFGRMIYGSEAFRESFKALLMTYAILFVGYSVADQDFRLLFDHHSELFGSKGPLRYSLMRGLKRIERDSLRRKNIQILAYDSYDEVPDFFRQLLSALQREPATETNEPHSDLTDILRPGAVIRRKRETLSPAEIITRFERGTALEVESLLLNNQREISEALQEHLGSERYERLRSRAAIRIERPRERVARGNVLVLPGLMASELALRNSSGRDSLVWVSPWQLIWGGVRKLSLTNSSGVVTPRLMTRYLGDLVLRLSERWNVLVFPYDWRRDFREVADELKQFLLSRLEDGAPCHIVAHGSGGLVVRAFIAQHRAAWDRLSPEESEDLAKGGRFVMLGTPNHGWFSAVTILSGGEAMLRKLALLDLRSNVEDVRRVFASFPSIYQTLPSPRYHSEWEALYDSHSYGGLEVSQSLLERGLAFHEMIATAIDPKRMVNILGHGKLTTSDVEKPNNLGESGHWIVTREGDGRTSHALARLDLDGVPVPTYFANESHGLLMMSEPVFEAVDEVLRIGTTFGLTSDPNVPLRRITPEEKLGR